MCLVMVRLALEGQGMETSPLRSDPIVMVCHLQASGLSLKE
jgi:hypothetical protein